MAKGKSEKPKEEEEIVGFFDEIPFSGSIKEKPSIIHREDVEGKKGGESVKEQLLRIWQTRINEESAHEAAEENYFSLQEIVKESEKIAVVRKDDMFASEITAEEQEIINQRIAAQQKQFQTYQHRENTKKFKKIRTVHSYITDDEALQALKECGDDEEEVCVYLTDYFNLQHVRKQIALAASKNEKKVVEKEDEENSNSEQDSDQEAEDAFDEDRPVRRKKTKITPAKSRKKGESKTKRLCLKLRLDDALAQGTTEGWSEARVKAYKLKDINPNAYYYRFNDPGQAQRNGKWTKEEVALFFRRMEEVGINGQWGIFSQTIPGRVGYQCSNFYRQLIESGQIKDANYYVDENGKAHYLFKKNRSRKGREADDSKGEGPEIGKPKTKRPRKQKKKKVEEEEEEEEEGLDEDDDDYRPHVSKKGKYQSDEEEEEDDEDAVEDVDNPLPDYIDPVTLCPVVKPAISPFGHVMSYATWSRCLSQEPRNRCPFTKKTVKKRDLVVLTWENIEQYRDKIVHVN